MAETDKVIKVLNDALHAKENYPWAKAEMSFEFIEMLLELLKKQDSRIKKYEYMFNFLGIGFREWETKIINGEAEVICEMDELNRETIVRFKHI